MERERDPANPQETGNQQQVDVDKERELREKTLDKTLADSFPTSDPPSTIPDPIPDPDQDEDSCAA